VKIVFDTNVLFSAFVAHGACAGLYEECLLRAVAWCCFGMAEKSHGEVNPESRSEAGS
jgi:hypothetical protein